MGVGFVWLVGEIVHDRGKELGDSSENNMKEKQKRFIILKHSFDLRKRLGATPLTVLTAL